MSLVLALLGTLRAALRTHTDLALENLALRQQLALLRRRSKRPQFALLDRLLWVWLSNQWAGWRDALHVVRPETVIRWHRQVSFAKTPSRDWTMGQGRASHEANGPRTRSVRRPARGAQNPHRPHAREPSAPATACPAPPPIEATAIRAPRSPPLGVALHPVGGVARGAPPRSPRDRDSLAPAGLPRLLDLEISSRASRPTAGRRGACGSRAHHGAGESALGRAAHSRRVAQARSRHLAARCRPAHAAWAETTLADVAHLPREPRRRPRLGRLLRRANRDLSRALRLRGPAASSPASLALQRH